MISVERGRDVRDFTLVAYGGAGPTHAAEIARELSIPRVLIPPFPGCASAFGAVISGSRRDFLRTVGRTVDRIDVGAVARLNEHLRGAARDALDDEGFAADAVDVQTWLDVRYEGQAHELSVELPGGRLDAGSIGGAVGGFHDLHRQLYGHAFDDVAVEVVNLRVKGLAVGPQPDMWWDWSRATRAGRLEPMRRVHMGPGAGFVDAAIAMRADIAVGDRIEGPAVIHQVDSTILVPPGFAAEALPGGSLLLGGREAFDAPRATTGGGAHGGRPVTDPITIEVIRHGLAAASREMGVTLRQTSCSPIFNEGNDYSCGDLRRPRAARQPRRVPPDPPRIAAVLGPLRDRVVRRRGPRARRRGAAQRPVPRRLAPARRHARHADLRRRRAGRVRGQPRAPPRRRRHRARQLLRGRHARTTRRACASRRSSCSARAELDDAAARARGRELPAAAPDAVDLAEPGLGQPTAIKRVRSSSSATARARRRRGRRCDPRRLRAPHARRHRRLAGRRLRGVRLRSTTTASPRSRARSASAVRIRGDEVGGRLHRQLAAGPPARSTACSDTPTPGVYMTFQAATDPDISPNGGCYRPIRDRRAGGDDRQPALPGGVHGRQRGHVRHPQRRVPRPRRGPARRAAPTRDGRRPGVVEQPAHLRRDDPRPASATSSTSTPRAVGAATPTATA